ncbi:hypothetical protein HY498_03175 [Candidatus Woesearchaeota archaeon]|nr:hypothetical protein [Candidatus Woesearchaeota archaeon]
MNKWLLLILFVILNSFYVLGATEVYDDFSSGGLDINKWNEIPGSDINNLFIDEHYVDTINEVYHTIQLTPEDRAITLEIKNRTFASGDIIEYDVNYIDGSGNRISRINVDNILISIFGFWNSVDDGGVGNDFGRYHIKITFTEEGANPEITLPNGIIKTTRGNLSSPSLEHTFGFQTRTGHNGIVHMDYDNVVIITTEPEPNLEERVEELENRVNELEEKAEEHESLLQKIIDFIKQLPEGLSKKWI